MPGSPNPSIISDLIAEFPETRRILIAFSGGLDSRVLLHLAIEALRGTDIDLLAIHVDHGVQEESAQWARTCRAICEHYAISLHILKASLALEKGQSLEAEARRERYRLMQSELKSGDLLLLAQHADDQVETVLLQLLRGAGPRGISAMPRVKQIPPGIVVRPLLEFSRDSLELLAKSHGLKWIDDPSNKDTRFDRNFLRHDIVPVLKQRFPSLQKTLARSARHCAEIVDLMDEHTGTELNRVLNPLDNSLPLSALRQLPLSRLKYLIRYWMTESGVLPPQERQLQVLVDAIQQPASARACSLATGSYHIRQYRDALYLVEATRPIKPYHYAWSLEQETLFIPELHIQLSRQSLAQQGIRLPKDATLQVRRRCGGEKIRLGQPAQHRSLKKLFQEQAVPTWRRDHYPLIFKGESLIAIPGLAVDPDYTC